MKTKLWISLLILASAAMEARAGNWPHWRGPNQDGETDEKGLPTKWSDTENIAWRTETTGRGASTPIIWGDRIFLTSQTGQNPEGQPPMGKKKNELVPNKPDYNVVYHSLCYNKADGKLLWSHDVQTDNLYPTHPKHGHATPSCVTDGELVYYWYGSGQLVAYDFEGNEKWARDLSKEYGPFVIIWGHGSSPILYKDMLILLCEHEPGAYILAVDKKTGANRYRVERDKNQRSYSTPLVIDVEGKDQLIVPTAGRVEGVDPMTGERLWWAKGLSLAVVPMAVQLNGVVYASGGYFSAPMLAVRPGKGDITDTQVLWAEKSGAGYTSSMIPVDNALYNFTERGIAKCFDANTGKDIWKERLGGEFSSSPITSEGRIWVTNEDGETFVIEASTEGMKVLSKNVISERTLGSMAVSDGRLFMRTDKALYCIGKM